MWNWEIRCRRGCGDIPHEERTQRGRMLVMWLWLSASPFLVNELILFLSSCLLVRLSLWKPPSWSLTSRRLDNVKIRPGICAAGRMVVFGFVLWLVLPVVALSSGPDHCGFHESSSSHNSEYETEWMHLINLFKMMRAFTVNIKVLLLFIPLLYFKHKCQTFHLKTLISQKQKRYFACLTVTVIRFHIRFV